MSTGIAFFNSELICGLTVYNDSNKLVDSFVATFQLLVTFKAINYFIIATVSFISSRDIVFYNCTCRGVIMMR